MAIYFASNCVDIEFLFCENYHYRFARAREAITTAETIELVRLLESRAAHYYWSAWRKVPINFPKCEFQRVPEYWRTFGTRVSPLTGSPRLAANPVNAMLNFLYAVLESETR